MHFKHFGTLALLNTAFTDKQNQNLSLPQGSFLHDRDFESVLISIRYNSGQSWLWNCFFAEIFSIDIYYSRKNHCQTREFRVHLKNRYCYHCFAICSSGNVFFSLYNFSISFNPFLFSFCFRLIKINRQICYCVVRDFISHFYLLKFITKQHGKRLFFATDIHNIIILLLQIQIKSNLVRAKIKRYNSAKKCV